MKAEIVIEVTLQTTMGKIGIETFPERAPLSVGAFLALVEDGSFTREASFYRAVRKDIDVRPVKINVLQGGLQEPSRSLAVIPHETTVDTGMRHLNGVVSLARAHTDSATGAAFFICLGDHPCLDWGGARNPDGQGYAAFGRVSEGMSLVRQIHMLPVMGEQLTSPVRFVCASRRH